MVTTHTQATRGNWARTEPGLYLRSAELQTFRRFWTSSWQGAPATCAPRHWLLVYTHTNSASVPTVSLHTHIPYVLLTPNGEHNRISVYCVLYVDNIYTCEPTLNLKEARSGTAAGATETTGQKEKKNESQTSLLQRQRQRQNLWIICVHKSVR